MNSEVLKIIAVIFIGAVLVLVLKTSRAEIGFLLMTAVSTVAFFLIINTYYSSAKSLMDIYKKAVGDNSTVLVVVKALVIAYLAEFCGNTCRDFGMSALGEKAEFAGKCAILALSVPLINSILKAALEIANI